MTQVQVHQQISAALSDLQLLRREQVQALTGLKKSTLYNMVASGAFPAQVRVGVRGSRWKSAEIRQWLEVQQ